MVSIRISISKTLVVMSMVALMTALLSSAPLAAYAEGLPTTDQGSSRSTTQIANSWRYENGQPKDQVPSDALNVQATGDEVADLTSATDSTTDETADTDAYSRADTLTREGIDVSEWNGSINWTKVASAVEFAIIRCGYGSDSSSQDDKRWIENVEGCTSAGLPMGVYLYSHAKNTTGAKSEAEHVIRCLEKANLTAKSVKLPIYLDMEDDSTANLSKAAQKSVFDQFKKTLNANGYSHVGIYSSSSWWSTKLSSIDLEAKYRWIASWGVSSPWQNYPDIQSKGCGVWQYSSDGTVSGISGRVDMNYAQVSWPFLDAQTTSSSVNMYRLYNPYSGEHLYTASAKEKNKLSKLGWKYEGIAWKAPESSDTPVYRLYNKYAPGGDHHYTTSKKEYDKLRSKGWKGEGIAWYSSDDETTPVYRVYNPNAYALGNSGAHHYTKSAKERNKLVKLGWKDEDIAWYGE